MSISEKRLAANRANAAKSTGPKSPKGKAISAQNSVRHSILANTVVLERESVERFTSLLQAFHKEFQPESEVELALMETMVVSRWRQMRIWGLEKASLTHEMNRMALCPEIGAPDDAPTQTAIAFRNLSDDSRALDLLTRYETRFDNQFSRALRRLNELRHRRGQSQIAAV
jgi:hypothetical protein